MRVEIVIDALVLNGIDHRDRHRIADALQRELARIVAADPQRWRHAVAGDVLQAADCVLTRRSAGFSASELGAQLAGTLAAAVTAPHARAGEGFPAPAAHDGTGRAASAGLPSRDRRGTP